MRHRAPIRIRRLGDISPLLRLQALAVLLVLNAGIANAVRSPVTLEAAQAGAATEVSAAPSASAAASPSGRARPPAPAKLVPAKRAPAKRVVRPKRYIPTGTGMWTYLWSRTEGGNTKAIVARAKRSGLSHIYVRTGTRKGGFDGQRVLNQVLKETRGTNIKIIAWDFPMLDNPIREARRLAAAAKHRAPGKGTPRVAAVAPDIETAAEGTRLTAAAVDTYYRELRRQLPKNVAILATIPWPSEHRIGKYPYAMTAKWADALVPMAYWINRDPTVVTRQTMQRLRGYGLPILPAGQAYDPRIDVPGVPWRAPSGRHVDAFIRTARAYGAPAVSLWVWNTASRDHWVTLKNARRYFLPKLPARKPAPVTPAVPAPPSAPAEPASRSKSAPVPAQRAG